MIYWNLIEILLTFMNGFIVSTFIFLLLEIQKIFLFCKKTMDNLAEQLSIIETSTNNNNCEIQKQRLKQFLKTNNGSAKKIFGKSLTEEKVDELNESDTKKYYDIYENYLARQMSDCLGKTIVSFYADLVGNKLLKIKDTNDLKFDLEKDPFTNAALRKFTCGLYFSFGEYLAPVTIGAITLKHCLKTSENFTKEIIEKNSDLKKDG